MADELAGKLNLFDGSVCRQQRTNRLEVTLSFERVRAILFVTLATQMADRGPSEQASRIAFVVARDRERAVQPPACWDDRTWRIRFDRDGP